MPKYRINGFEQIKSFYSWVFNNQDKRVTPQHISLYNFLINQNNRNNWVEWFKCPFDLAMAGSCIGNKKTYYSCLEDLRIWNLIDYQKGVNNWKAPLIKIEVLKCTSTDTATVPQGEPLLVPQHIPLPTPLPTHIYKLLTNNLKIITDNLELIISFLQKENLLLPKTEPTTIPEEEERKKVAPKKEKEFAYQECMAVYNDFIKQKLDIPPKINGAEGKSLKNIISYLKPIVNIQPPTEEIIVNSLKAIFDNYDKWDKFHQGQLKLTQIDSNLINIINSIKNGRTKGTKQGITTNELKSVIDSIQTDPRFK